MMRISREEWVGRWLRALFSACWDTRKEWKVDDLPHRAFRHLDRVLETGIASWL